MTDTPTAEIVKRLLELAEHSALGMEVALSERDRAAYQNDAHDLKEAASRLEQLEAQVVVAQSLCQNWQDGSVRLHKEMQDAT